MERKNVIRAVVAAALGVAGALAAAAPAQAAGQLVLFDDRNQRGGAFGFGSSDANICDLVCASDRASSVSNGMTVAWVLYDDSGFGDRRFCLRPGQHINNLHDSRWVFGDKISSVKKLNTSSCSGYPVFT